MSYVLVNLSSDAYDLLHGCYWGVCAQPDVTGILVRTSAYVIHWCVAIIIFDSSEEETETAYWAQMLALYSVEISALVSIGTGSFSRIHTMLAGAIVTSPLSLALWLSAILSLVGVEASDRLTAVTRPWVPKIASILSGLMAFALWSVWLVPSVPFSQNVCGILGDDGAVAPGTTDVIRIMMYLAGIVLLFSVVWMHASKLASSSNIVTAPIFWRYGHFRQLWWSRAWAGYGIALCIDLALCVLTSAALVVFMFIWYNPGTTPSHPIYIFKSILMGTTVAAWIYAIWRERHAIFQRKHISLIVIFAWKIPRAKYPVLYWVTARVLPFVLWVLTIETFINPPDNLQWFSYGQLISVFATIPPLLQVISIARQYLHRVHQRLTSQAEVHLQRAPLIRVLRVTVPNAVRAWMPIVSRNRQWFYPGMPSSGATPYDDDIELMPRTATSNSPNMGDGLKRPSRASTYTVPRSSRDHNETPRVWGGRTRPARYQSLDGKSSPS